MSIYDADVRYVASSEPSSPVLPSGLGIDFQGRGRFEEGGALRQEKPDPNSSREPKNKKKELQAAAVPLNASGALTPDCKCKTKQALEGDRIAALATMKLVALAGSDKARRDIPTKMEFMY